ncbi:MAG: DUF5606 domain-containing protein [Bacteroidales bacterium]|jgi:hypothetical protein|nr:DUF5606 domain-containing protein [Bacteroidales bacterium]
MDLSKILFITGRGGLFELVSQTKTGAIVEDMATGKRFPVFNNNKISVLENISIYRENSDIALPELLKLIFKKENGGKCIDHLASEDLIRGYMEEILPDFDDTQVHLSDMRKIFNWYNILNEKGMIDIEDDVTDTKE